MIHRSFLQRWRWPLLAASALIALGISTLREEPVEQSSAMHEATQEERVPLASGPATSSDDPLPWANTAAGTTALSNRPALAGIDAAALGRLQNNPAEQQRLIARIERQSAQNLSNIDSAIAELEKLERNGQIPAEVNTADVRRRLRLVRRAQELAAQMLQLTRAPGALNDRSQLDPILNELTEVQQQLQSTGTNPAMGVR